MSPLADRLAALEAAIGEACRRAGRRRDELTLVAVSKRHPDEAVAALAALGVTDFGENQVQAWRRRRQSLPQLDVRWHLIGPIQRNKVRYISADPPALVHTVDRLPLVEALDSRLGAPLPVLIQVDVDRESQKAGVDPDQLDALADAVAATSALRLRGVMCIPRRGTSAEARDAFARTRRLAERIADRIEGPSPILSMGMSGDFEIAIAEGATMIRVGTALFGPRPAVDGPGAQRA